MAIVDKLSIKLKQYGLPFQYLLADAGFSSGENYAFLEANKIKAYISLHGSYHPNWPRNRVNQGKDLAMI